MVSDYTPPPYSHRTSVRLYSALGFTAMSPTMRRVAVAVWEVKYGDPHKHPNLTDAEKKYVDRIRREDGYEVMLELVQAADELEARTAQHW